MRHTAYSCLLGVVACPFSVSVSSYLVSEGNDRRCSPSQCTFIFPHLGFWPESVTAFLVMINTEEFFFFLILHDFSVNLLNSLVAAGIICESKMYSIPGVQPWVEIQGC